MEWFKRLFSSKPKEVKQEQSEVIPGKLVLIKAGFQDDGQLRVEVDYDAEFVAGLRQRGYTGVNEHDLVMRYVAEVHRAILQNNNIGYD